jgi:hypothetical protein
MGPGDFGAMLKAIKDGKALMVRNRGRGQRIYWCKIRSAYERIYVLVGRGGMILTAWPPTSEITGYRRQAQARQEAERKRHAATR